jgi:hypothetical protein
MGHEDYVTLQRYVRLAMERGLGRLEDWTADGPGVVVLRTLVRSQYHPLNNERYVGLILGMR